MLIGYARVSTQDQTPDLQLDALRAAGCGRVFMEKASGASRARPELARALKALGPGDTLVVWKMDRLARSLRQLIDMLDHLKNKDCGFRSLTEAIDTSTSTGKLVFHMLAAVAEFERDVIRDRTLAGLASAKARGRQGGRPRVLDQHSVQEARRLLSATNLTVEEVARRQNVAVSTLYRYLHGGGKTLGT